MDKPRFVYVIYVSATPEKVWNALIDSELTRRYWQHENVSDWKPGSRWEHRRSDGSGRIDLVGTVIENAPPHRLVLSWTDPTDAERDEAYSRVTFEIEPYRDVTRLTVTHDNLEPDSDMLRGITDGWPKVLSSLKTILESGEPLPQLW
jgi:uncharacterized protein YndB with AHSA1/START domain